MAKGNPKAYLNARNDPITDAPKVTEDENRNIIELCLETFNAPIPDINDPVQVQAAVAGYFKSCIDRGLRPGNMGLYARLGKSRQDINNYVHGRVKINPAALDILKKALETLSQLREQYGATGKLNPVTLIFWQKNYDGLTDVQQIEVSASDHTQAEYTPEQIAAAIDADIPNE